MKTNTLTIICTFFLSLALVLSVNSLSDKIQNVAASVKSLPQTSENISLSAVESKLEELKKMQETLHATQKVLDETLNKNTEKLNNLKPRIITKRINKNKFVRKTRKHVKTCKG